MLKELLNLAEDIARKLSVNDYVMGYVTRVRPVDVKEGRNLISIDVSFHDYLKLGTEGGYLPGIGSILCIVNPIAKTLVLGIVRGFRREDLASIMNIPIPTPPKDPSTLQTPLILNLELIAEADIREELSNIRPPATPIEPGSPVIIPKPNIVKEMLGVPKQGVLIGHLISGSQIRYDIDIRLPLDTFYHHILVIGTTGSGKTVLLKNIALSVIREYSKEDPLIVAFDLQGDYLTLTQPNRGPSNELRMYEPLSEITVIIPVTKLVINHVRDVDRINELAKKLVDMYISTGYKDPNIKVVSIRQSSIEDTVDYKEVTIKPIDIMLRNSENREFKLTLIPWALTYSRVRDEIQDLMPIFTEQARFFLPKLLREVHERGVKESLSSVIENNYQLRNIGEELSIHRSTLENIIRGLILLNDTGLFDVDIKIGDTEVKFTEPDYFKLFSKCPNMLVVDLRWARLYSPSPYTETLITYRILEKVFEWKDEMLRVGARSRPTLLLIDEAHNYFPQTSREALGKDLVESTINKITRLGRIRGIGVVFATHQPSDLNNLVIQLTNTKIAFRSDRSSLEAISLGEFFEELRNAPSGYAVMSTYAIGIQTLTVKTLPPQTLHQP